VGTNAVTQPDEMQRFGEGQIDEDAVVQQCSSRGGLVTPEHSSALPALWYSG